MFAQRAARGARRVQRGGRGVQGGAGDLQKCAMFYKKGVQGVKGGARQNLARDGLGGHVVGGDLPLTGNVMLHIYWRSGSISFSRSGNSDT